MAASTRHYTYRKQAVAAAKKSGGTIAFETGKGYYLKPAAGVPRKPQAPKTAAPKTGMAGLYGGQGPVAYVNNLYQPQEAALAAQQGARSAALKAMVGQFLDSLKGVSSELAPYTAEASQQNSDAANAAASLLAANPNAITQADLAAINAPQAQRDQVAAQNNTAFGGNAALLKYAGGAVPAGVFKADAASQASYLNALPAIAANYGVQGANQLANLASQENSKLASDKANALQQARSDLANYVQGNQKLRLDAQNQAFSQAATTTRLNQSQQRLDLSSQVDAFNQKYKIADLNLASQKFAQSALNQNRNYQVALKRIGISTKSLQLRAMQQEYKLKSGGFTPLQVNKFKTSAFNVAQNAFNGISEDASRDGKAHPAIGYQAAIKEMRASGVPLSIALPALKEAGYKPGVRGAPFDEASSLPLQGPGLGSRGSNIVTAAASMLGTPYKWGGNTPGKALDCSAFIQQTYAKLGIKIPRTTYAQVKAGRPVMLNQLQPGDAIFTELGKNGPNHVGLYIGSGLVQESPHTGDVNKIIPLKDFLSGGFVAARRYVGN